MGEEGKIQFSVNADWKRAMLSHTAQWNRRKILNHFWRSLGLWEAAHLSFFLPGEEYGSVVCLLLPENTFCTAKNSKTRGNIKKATIANTPLWHWAAPASAASPISLITHCIMQTKPQNNKTRKSQKAAPHLILFMDCNTHSDRSLFALPSFKSKEKLY